MSQKSDQRIVEIKLRAVAALAESLSEDICNGKLWEGECIKGIGTIQRELNAAYNAAKKFDDSNPY